MNNKSNRGILIEQVLAKCTQQNMFNTIVELKKSLEESLNLNLMFNTEVSDIKDKNGFILGQISFKNENNIDSVIDFTIMNNKVEVYE